MLPINECTRACSVCTRAELQQLVKVIIVQLPRGAQNTHRGYLKPPSSLSGKGTLLNVQHSRWSGTSLQQETAISRPELFSQSVATC
jgi:hypothetical protein